MKQLIIVHYPRDLSLGRPDVFGNPKGKIMAHEPTKNIFLHLMDKILHQFECSKHCHHYRTGYVYLVQEVVHQHYQGHQRQMNKDDATVGNRTSHHSHEITPSISLIGQLL